MNVRNIIGSQVRKIRKDRGLTQNDLSARCGVIGFDISRETIGQIERRIRTVSDLETALLAKSLKVDVRELFPQRLPTWKRDSRCPRKKA